MTEKKSLVEEAIIQMKNLEEVIAENAKGILASTMKQEIKELVKESLNETDEDDDEVEDEMDVEMGDEDFDDEEFEMPMDTDMDDEDEETLDLTDMDDIESVVKIFAALEDGDEIEVVPDEPGKVHFKDKRTNKEYIIMTESEMEQELEDAIENTFMEEYEDEEFEFDTEEDEDSDLEFMSMDEEEEMVGLGMEEPTEEDYMDEMYGETEEETIYELEIEEEDEIDIEDEDFMMESKTMKAKGVKGHGPKFEYKEVSYKKDKMKKGDEAPYTGKPSYKFDMKSPSLKGEFKEEKHSTMKSHSKMEKKEGMMKPHKEETKEAARTLGQGSNFRKGGLPKPRAHSKFNANIEESVNPQELEILREKNEEYRKALNVFRTKLNEVAVFNSNLAYATRLFTEHSTSKQEKINILQRFDSVESLKESKNLYKIIKDELSTSKGQQVNESIERTIQKTPSTGSAINLIESKTYENPQFQRMKDLMSKIK